MKEGKSDVFADLAEYLGSDVAEAAKELAKKDDYSEFKLAEALGRDVNETRNLLYKLHDASLATFIKKKDNKIGWYIYYWTFQEGSVTGFLLAEKKARLASLREKVSGQEKSNYFSCANKCMSVDFDKAFELSFHCPECGSLLGQENNKGKVDTWGREAASLEKDLRGLEALKAREGADRDTKNAAKELEGKPKRKNQAAV